MAQKLDLLLVNPNAKKKVYGSLGSSLSGIEPPIWCGLTAAFMRKHGYSVKIIDAEAGNMSQEETAGNIAKENPLLVDIVVMGITPSASSTPKMVAVREIITASKEKSPHIKILLSGLHPSALPERTLREEDVDFICQGEGFYTILQLLEVLKLDRESSDCKIPGLWYIQNGKAISNHPAPLVNPDELPFAAWDLLPMGKYRAHNWHCFNHIDQRKSYAVIYTSLGCPFKCTYCNIHTLYGGPSIRFRSPEKVVEEIDFLVRNYEIRNLKILDELFVLREDHVMRICDLIIQGGYDLNIWAYARVDTVNRNVLKKMKQAGINWICFGFESASQKVRKGVTKKNEDDAVKKAIDMTRVAGIYILANFMFGLPDDDFETMQETLDMAKKFNFEYVNFYTVMAYPGSQLYEDAAKQGIKLPETWLGYSQYSEETLPLSTKYLSAADVLRFRDNAFKEYYKNPKYLEMIKEKFGPKAVEHIEEMLKHEIHRKFV